MSQAACCTCASLLTAVPRVSSSSEKPLPDDRHLDCCGRTICGACIHRNTRFLSYCPYCQTSGQSPLSRRLKTRPRQREDEPEPEPDSESDPPPYSAIAQTLNTTERPVPPPPYTTSPSLPHSAPNPPSNPKQQAPPEKETEKEKEPQPAAGYTIHHLRHPPHPSPDTLLSLSLQYGIPLPVLRQHNRLPSGADYLLAARNTLLIPTAYITNTSTTTTIPPNPTPNKFDDGESAGTSVVSLSPHPPDSAAERERKIAVRRFMVACKESDYGTAVVYLEERGYNFAAAVQQYREDVEWEGMHPLMVGHHPLGLGDRGKGKGRVNNMGKGVGGNKGLLKTGEGGGRLLGWLKG